MDIRTAIWDARLDAKLAAAYYARKTTRYQRLNRMMATVVALCGSAAVAAWVNESASPVVPVFALLAAVLAVLPYPALLTKWTLEAELACTHWTHRDLAWDLLWIEVDGSPDAVSHERFAAARAQDLAFYEPSSPPSSRLSSRCRLDVHRSLGLEVPKAHS